MKRLSNWLPAILRSSQDWNPLFFLISSVEILELEDPPSLSGLKFSTSKTWVLNYPTDLPVGKEEENYTSTTWEAGFQGRAITLPSLSAGLTTVNYLILYLLGVKKNLLEFYILLLSTRVLGINNNSSSEYCGLAFLIRSLLYVRWVLHELRHGVSVCNTGFVRSHWPHVMVLT